MKRYRLESVDGTLFVLEPYTVYGEGAMRQRRRDPRFAGQFASLVEADPEEPIGELRRVLEPLYY